jgi:mitotic spindle assembly checkpoint protein MAD1
MLEDSNVKNSRLRIDYDMKIEKLTNDLLREKDKFFELEKQLKFNQQKCDEVSTQLTTAREEFSVEYEKHQKKVTELQKQNSTLSMNINDIKMENESIKVKHQSELIAVEHKIEILENELLKMNQEKEISEKHKEEVLLLAKEAEVISAEYHNAKLDILRLENEVKLYKDGAKLSEILRNEIQELKNFKEENVTLKRENELLNDVQNKNMILQEKLIGLESELKICQNKLENAVKMDVNYNNIQSRLNEWEETLATSSPCRVSSQITELQKNEVVLRTEIGSLKTELNELTSFKSQSEYALRSAQKELNDYKKKVSDQTELIKKLNRKCLLFSKERESYKRLISSYELDVTIDINKISQERIASLEATIDEYKTFIDQLENELNQLKNQTKINNFESEINDLKNEITRLREINSQLENINKSLVENNESCRDNNPNANPISQNIEQDIDNYRKLIEENQKLMAKIELLESGNDQEMSRKIDEGLKYNSISLIY